MVIRGNLNLTGNLLTDKVTSPRFSLNLIEFADSLTSK